MLDFCRLTALDLYILDGLLNGESNTQIADRLCITVKMVQHRCTRIRQVFNGETHNHTAPL